MYISRAEHIAFDNLCVYVKIFPFDGMAGYVLVRFIAMLVVEACKRSELIVEAFHLGGGVRLR